MVRIAYALLCSPIDGERKVKIEQGTCNDEVQIERLGTKQVGDSIFVSSRPKKNPMSGDLFR